MRLVDWVVLIGTLTTIIAYGLYRGRRSGTVDQYLLAGKSMPWYAMGLSIMATQASAVTFISTTGQSYVDGMRFVQFYFGLPVAIVIISSTAVRIFHRAKVYTAYEYLENRFDTKTRILASITFLTLRGFSSAFTLYAPAIVLSVIFGWPDHVTTVVMGCTVVLYTVLGGIKTVTWTDVQQMTIIFFGLIVALVTIFVLLPPGVSVGDAVHLAGAAGRINVVDLKFDPNSRYNVWSGLIGGTFLFLSYFGCDQSQVQRYLTGKSIAQSKLALLFNAMAKIPMQFFILFIGAMVFVFYMFIQPPMLFERVQMSRIQSEPGYAAVAQSYQRAFEERRQAALRLVDARHRGEVAPAGMARFRQAQRDLDLARSQATKLAQQAGAPNDFTDTNYIFLTFVTEYLPAGIVGLVIAVIFAAAMSASSGEINALATVTVIDIYRRLIKGDGTDHHYLNASRAFTAFWGAWAVTFAGLGKSLGALIEGVNVIGSLFYGTLLGVFVLAFGFRRVGGTAAFAGMLAGEAAILYSYFFTKIAYLWYSLIGCAMVVLVALAITAFVPPTSARQARPVPERR